jgi:uncharacterized membrane protein
MTNPTTPFGWQMPTSTDLVTDLPADFETFGQAVATSMADLLGGTTNQVLAKNSNADMDFKWVADASGIPATIIDAKGDLIAGTAADTAARLAVGANDLLLTADSAEATGLKYTGGWTTWTPTLTNMTLGNGTVTARYQKIGKIVNGYFQFVLGTTSAISSFPNFSLPITPSQGFMTFPAWYKDEGVNDYFGMVATLTSGNLWPRVGYAVGTYVSDYAISATIPFTWGATDRFFCEFSYEVA